MFTVRKMHKRLHVVGADGDSVYTPPDFLRSRIQSREALQRLADAFNAAGAYTIEAVVEFERSLPRKT